MRPRQAASRAAEGRPGSGKRQEEGRGQGPRRAMGLQHPRWGGVFPPALIRHRMGNASPGGQGQNHCTATVSKSWGGVWESALHAPRNSCACGVLGMLGSQVAQDLPSQLRQLTPWGKHRFASHRHLQAELGQSLPLGQPGDPWGGKNENYVVVICGVLMGTSTTCSLYMSYFT